MTPEDVRSEIRLMKERANRLALNEKSLVAQRIAKELSRILSWKFNEFHDGANHTVGEYRFWFKIAKGGFVTTGYQHNSPVAGTNQSIPWKVPYPEFKGVTSLQQIDTLFQLMHPAYK
jgi:hypothetical protein